MNAADHLARAEELLAGPGVSEGTDWHMLDLAMTVNGLAHAVIAVAIELGVPHPNAPAPGGSSG